MGFVYFVKHDGSDVYALRSTAAADPGNVDAKIPSDDPPECESFLQHYFESKCVDRKAKLFRLGSEDLGVAFKAAEGFVRRFVPLQHSVEQLKTQTSSNRLVAPERRHGELCRQIRELREQEFRISKRRELLENELKVAIGTAAGIEGLATWRSHVQNSFDRERFKAEHPDMFNSYVHPKIMRTLQLI
jgi:hypothetical protein